MVKIELLKSVSGIDFSFAAGETATVHEDLAADLIQAGHAKAFKAGPETASINEKKIETAAAKPAAGKKR